MSPFIRRAAALVALLLTVVVLPVAAQTTATLTGTVTSGSSPLPGVTVTASSPALQSPRSTVTGDTGSYSIPGLPPGDYTITFSLSGLESQTRRVALGLAQTARADADMQVTALSDAITVTATAPAVLESPGISTNVSQETLNELPTQRNILAAVALAPGVAQGLAGRADNPNAGFSISGAASSDSLYVINGVTVNENLRGQPHNLFIEDAVQETTILTTGISAEYGRFTGGVVSAITRSGGNDFSGSVRDTLTNAAWTGETPNQTAPNRDKINHQYEGTLGGYILRDRLWFFGAARLAKTDQQFFTSQTNIGFTRNTNQKRYEGKLTGQITPKHTLVGSYLDISDKRENDFDFAGIMDLQSTYNRQLPNSLASLQYNGVITNNLLVEAIYAKKDFSFVGAGSPYTDRIQGTLLVDVSNTNRRWWAPTFCGVCGDEGRNNESYLLKTNYFLSSGRFGTHSIVAGAENFAEQRIANNHQSGSDFRILHTVVRDGAELRARFDSSTTIQWNPIFSASEGSDLQTRSLFINDRWDLNNRLSFNVGLRYDQNDAKNADGVVVSDDSAFSPRLGVQYDVRGDGRHRVNASYGVYVNKIAEGNVAGGAQSAGNPSTFQWRYAGPAINPAGTPFSQMVSTEQALQQLWAWFDSIGGTNNAEFRTFAFVSGLGTRMSGELQSPSVEEITVGYGLQVTPNAYLRADLIKRDWQDFYATRLNTLTPRSLDQFGSRGDVGIIENTNDIVREYRGAILSGQWNHRGLNVGGNYTWSTLEGNDETEGVTTGTSPTTPLGMFYPEYLGYANRLPFGYLPEDVRHRARAWIGYDFNLGPVGVLNLSLLQQYQTGSAYSAIGIIDAGTSPGAPTLIAYTLSQLGNRHNYYFTGRGELRTDAFNSTDIGATYTLPLASVNLFLQANVLNVLDVDGVIVPNATILTRRANGAASGLAAFNPFTETPIECPQGAAASVCSAMGAHWQKGPSFGGPIDANSYQTPRTYRFSAGIRF